MELSLLDVGFLRYTACTLAFSAYVLAHYFFGNHVVRDDDVERCCRDMYATIKYPNRTVHAKYATSGYLSASLWVEHAVLYVLSIVSRLTADTNVTLIT
jgi:hypothetical protein